MKDIGEVMLEYQEASANTQTPLNTPQPPQTLSIAMTTFNGARFLEEQLESLVNQTFLPLELIITDDGSTDRTAEIVSKFAATAPFTIQYHRNATRLGFADNFFHAASLCKGDLIAFCDQDDVWLPNKLLECVNAFSAPDALLCVHTSRIWDGENFSANWPDFKTWSCVLPGEADILTVYPGFSMVLRRELLQIMDSSHRPTNLLSLSAKKGPVSHDQWVWIMASVFGSIVQLPTPLAHYRQHATNTQGAIHHDLKRKISLMIGRTNYVEIAEVAREYAQFFADAAVNLPEPRAKMALEAAARMEKRADFLNTRARIYQQRLSFILRFKAWLKLAFAQGYVDDKTNTSLGRKAFLKDAIFGVTGVYRLTL